MKTDDNVTKEVEQLLVRIGYKGSFPIEVRPACEWLEKHYPESVLKNNYHLDRSDLFALAHKKYPPIIDFGYDPLDRNYYEKRNHIVLLAIQEIIANKQKPSSPIDPNYIPFGDEWDKEIMKLPKKALVEMLKKQLQNKKLKNENKRFAKLRNKSR